MPIPLDEIFDKTTSITAKDYELLTRRSEELKDAFQHYVLRREENSRGPAIRAARELGTLIEHHFQLPLAQVQNEIVTALNEIRTDRDYEAKKILGYWLGFVNSYVRPMK